MTKKVFNDSAAVVVFPPIIPLVTTALALLLQRLAPIGALATIEPSIRAATGLTLLALGLALTIAGARGLKQRNTNINPRLPTLALATTGVYAWTRNPMYDGGFPIMLGLALIFTVDWLALLTAPTYVILHMGVITREEEYLDRKFGEAYRSYCARVPRHLLLSLPCALLLVPLAAAPLAMHGIQAKQAELQAQRLFEINAEHDFYCRKWGMQFASERYRSCILDLEEFRNRVERNLADQVAF
jgi:protein-S-isoprenylcysteine O-methyltransferase Ste14